MRRDSLKVTDPGGAERDRKPAGRPAAMTETPSIVLASASGIRAGLLRQNGVAFEIVPARIDETAILEAMQSEAAPARDIADALAEMKALRVSQRMPGALVIGCDQVLVCEGRLFQKPTDLLEARAHLSTLRGKTHELLSAVVVCRDSRPEWRHIGRAQLTMREFSDAFLDDYVARHGDDLLATVGCYKLEEDGASLFSRVAGDYFSILGLPLLELLGFLRMRGMIGE